MGQMLHASVVSAMFLIKLSQCLRFCGVEGGFNFLLQVFQVLAGTDHAMVATGLLPVMLCCGFVSLPRVK